MKAAQFRYARPASVPDALSALARGDAGAKVMGGSQSLGPMLNLRLARPAAVVDVSALQELRTVATEGDTIRIGAAVTHAEIEDGVHPPLRGTLLQHVAGGIAYRAVRTRGTLGGSLAHADPAADWVLTMTALAARLELRSSSGQRQVAMDGFMRGAYTTVLEPDEILAAIRIPVLGPAARWGYYKVCRKPGEFAEASCACVFDSGRALARVVIGALDGAPKVLPQLAATVAATGVVPDEQEIAAAVASVAAGKDEVDRQLLGAAVRRCLRQAVIGRDAQ